MDDRLRRRKKRPPSGRPLKRTVSRRERRTAQAIGVRAVGAEIDRHRPAHRAGWEVLSPAEMPEDDWPTESRLDEGPEPEPEPVTAPMLASRA